MFCLGAPRLTPALLLAQLLIGAPVAAAQDGVPTRFAVMLGLTIRDADTRALGGDLGGHVVFAVTRARPGAFGWRSDASLHLFGGAASIASCPQDVACEEQRNLSFLAGTGFSLVARPAAAGGTMSLLAGPAVFHARTSGGSRTHTALALSTGLRLSPPEPAQSRLGIEVRSLYMLGGLGEIRWLFTPSVVLSF